MKYNYSGNLTTVCLGRKNKKDCFDNFADQAIEIWEIYLDH